MAQKLNLRILINKQVRPTWVQLATVRLKITATTRADKECIQPALKHDIRGQAR